MVQLWYGYQDIYIDIPSKELDRWMPHLYYCSGCPYLHANPKGASMDLFIESLKRIYNWRSGKEVECQTLSSG